MRAAVIVLNHYNQNQARELIAGARQAGASELFAIVLGLRQDLETLPVDRCVLIPQGQHCHANEQAAAIRRVLDELAVQLVLLYADKDGNGLAPLLWQQGMACRLNVTELTPNEHHGLVVVRRVYAMNLMGEQRITMPAVITLAEGCFPAEKSAAKPEWTVTKEIAEAGWRLESAIEPLVRQRRLSDYPVVLVGGRGIGSRANAEKLMRLGKLLQVGVGATRPAVYSGWFPYEALVGASGERIAPELCVTFGVSGCAALLMGIEKSKRIVSINNDCDAAIFDHSDIGMVADCTQMLDRLLSLAEQNTMA